MADMKGVTENESRLYTLTTLVVVIGFLAFLQSNIAEYSYRVSILGRNAICAMVAVSMNLLTGLTGLFSLGQAGFMTIGAYMVAIFTIPMEFRAGVYYINGISPVIANTQLPIPVALLLGGLATAAIATLIGILVLCSKSDYLTVTTLGSSEIIRAFITAPVFDIIINGSYGFKNIPGFPNIFMVFGLAALYIALMVLLINSSYNRAFKSIREDEVAARSMGISLFHYRELSLVIPSFFTGVGGGILAMFMRPIDSRTFQVALTYDTLLVVVLGDIGSVTGNMADVFLVTAGRELLRFFDDPLTIAGVSIPLFHFGFRVVILSILLMTVVPFYSRGIMGNHEFPWDELLWLIRGTPGRFKRGREKPSSAKEEGIH